MILKTKLLILFIQIALIPLILFSVLSFQNIQGYLLESSLKNLESLSNLNSKRLENYLLQNKLELESIASDDNVKNYFLSVKYSVSPTSTISNQELLSRLSTTAKSSKNLEAVLLIHKNGHLIASSQENTKENALIDNDTLNKLVSSTKTVYFFKDKYGRTMVRLSKELLEDNMPIGKVLTIIRTSDLASITNDFTGLGNSGETIIVFNNNDGRLTFLNALRYDASLGFSEIQRISDYNSVFDLARNQKSGYIANSLDYRGLGVLAYSNYLSDSGISVVTKIDQLEVYSNADRIKNLFLLFVLCSALIIAVISLVVSSSISNPIIKLRDTAKMIAAGKFKSSLQIETKDEIGDLANTFNIMAASLNDLYSNLENKVEDRTRSLVESKKEIETQKVKDEAILQNLGEGLVVYDLDGKIIMMNEMAEITTKLKFSEVKNQDFRNFWELFYKKDGPIGAEQCPFKRILDKKKNISENQYIFKGKNGVKFPIAYTFSPIIKENEMIGVVEIFSDVTHEKELETMKDEFISIASHELRTPMTAIKGMMSMILEGDFGEIGEKLKDPLVSVSTSSQRLISLVNDMLDVSSLDAGKLKLNLSDINLQTSIESVIAELDVIAKQKNLVIEKNNVESVWVQADADKLTEVLNNLIGNSLKFTKQGKIVIGTHKEQDIVKVYVTDTGSGISKEDQSKLFNKFQQLGNELNNHIQGTGLGLYITKQILKKMGGDLWIDNSEVGKGTTFAFSLPASNTQLAKITKSKFLKENL